MSWAHRRFCAIDGRAVAHSSYFPLGGYLSTFLSVMPPVMRLHLIGAVFCDGRGQIGLTHRRSCAFDGRAVACLSYSPFRWLSTHRPSRDAAYDAFALDRCRLLRWQGPDWTNAPTFLRFRRACVRWLVFPYSPFWWLATPLSGFALTSTCVLFAALRACWSRRSQVDVRARRALSGAGDRPSSRCSVPATRWRLPLALLLRRGSG